MNSRIIDVIYSSHSHKNCINQLFYIQKTIENESFGGSFYFKPFRNNVFWFFNILIINILYYL